MHPNTEPHTAQASSPLEHAEAKTVRRTGGVVCRLASDRRFGYVRTDDGSGTLIFLVGIAIAHRDAVGLRVGGRVDLWLDERDRVERLAVA